MRFSWTQLEMYDACPWRHHLHYVQKLRVPDDPRPFLVGRVVHDAVKDWAEAGFPAGVVARIVPAQFKRQFKGYSFKSRAKLKELFERSLAGALRVEHAYRLFKLPEHGVVIEERFSIPLAGGHTLQGGADAYDPVDRGLYDLKMYSGDGKGKPEQLRTYGMAMRAKGRPVDFGGFIYPLRPKDWWDRHAVTEADLDAQEAKINGIVDLIASGRSDPQPTPGDACRWCEYHRTAHCPATFKIGMQTPGVGARAPRMSFSEGTAAG